MDFDKIQVAEDDEYMQANVFEHVMLRPNHYVGSTEVTHTNMYVLKDEHQFVEKKIKFSPAVLKIVDEILVNAIDHFIRHNKKVKYIKIYFSDEGVIKIINNGPGLPLKNFETKEGKIKPQAEAIYSEFMSGTNLTNNETRIVGGQNGLGAKLTNRFSKFFNVTSVSGGKKFTQKFKNNLEDVEAPVIVELEPKKVNGKVIPITDYTEIEFLPDYKSLGYSEFKEAEMADLYKIIEARAMQTAVFVRCKVYFNDKLIDLDFEKFVSMFPRTTEETYSAVYRCKESNEKDNLPLEVIIGTTSNGLKHFSILNGINVYLGGSHISAIKNDIAEALESKAKKLLNTDRIKKMKDYICSNIFIFVKGIILNPSFNSQSKVKLTNSDKYFTNFKFASSDYKGIWECIKDHLANSAEIHMEEKKTKVTRKTIAITKGEDALFAGNVNKSSQCTLIICEGDSALLTVQSGINNKKVGIDKDYFGTFSIQGVPLNSKKEIIGNDPNSRVRTQKAIDNKRYKELEQVLGLCRSKTYDKNTEEGRKEFKSLRYGRIIGAMDQDVDGKGQIFGLIVTHFMQFWPKLSDWKFILRFNTPIIRAYPKNKKHKVMEFYSKFQYDRMIQEKYSGEESKIKKKYKIQYYKGLGTHDGREIKPLFTNFETKLLTYVLDENAPRTMEIYYGKETNERKKILMPPRKEVDIYSDGNVIKISDFMNTDVLEFQKDNIGRKLPNVIDGLNPAKRKALYAAIKYQKEEMKVCNFTGLTSEKVNYHHGDTTLAQTIIKMAQAYVGGKNLPLLIGRGQFGSRIVGAKGAASPRYTYIKLNEDLVSLLYPRVDDDLLEYTVDEGIQGEPVNFCPIIPMCVLEYVCIPATGFKVEIWPQDYKLVYKNVVNMIKTGKKCGTLDIWLRGNSSEIRYGSDDKTYVVGKYKMSKMKGVKKNTEIDVLTVTELPPYINNNTYIKAVGLTKEGKFKPEFLFIRDNTNEDADTNEENVEIEFGLNEGVYEEWCAVVDDPNNICTHIEQVMGLCKKINSHINLVTGDMQILQYEYYSHVVNYWFKKRKALYIRRIKRQIILTELRILYLENLVRFISEKPKYRIETIEDEVSLIELLEEHKYDRFNRAQLNKNDDIKTKDLRDKILNNLENGCNYVYITSLSITQTIKKYHDLKKKELEDEKKILEDLNADNKTDGHNFPGMNTWLAELKALDKVIKKGIKYGWSHEDEPYIFE